MKAMAASAWSGRGGPRWPPPRALGPRGGPASGQREPPPPAQRPPGRPGGARGGAPPKRPPGPPELGRAGRRPSPGCRPPGPPGSRPRRKSTPKALALGAGGMGTQIEALIPLFPVSFGPPCLGPPCWRKPAWGGIRPPGHATGGRSFASLRWWSGGDLNPRPPACKLGKGAKRTIPPMLPLSEPLL